MSAEHRQSVLQIVPEAVIQRENGEGRRAPDTAAQLFRGVFQRQKPPAARLDEADDGIQELRRHVEPGIGSETFTASRRTHVVQHENRAATSRKGPRQP